jgi:hypothetical protein
MDFANRRVSVFPVRDKGASQKLDMLWSGSGAGFF